MLTVQNCFSYRLSVSVELKSRQESNTTLAKELAEFQNQIKEQQQQLAESQLSKDKAKEEYARYVDGCCPHRVDTAP